MPMRLFWEFSGQVPRLLADEQKQQLEIAAAGQNGEAIRELQQVLVKAAPEPVTLTVEARIAASSVRDENAADMLRALQG